LQQRYGRSSWRTPGSRVTRHGWRCGAVWRLFGSSNGGRLDLLISLEKLPYYQKISRSAPNHKEYVVSGTVIGPWLRKACGGKRRSLHLHRADEVLYKGSSLPWSSHQRTSPLRKEKPHQLEPFYRLFEHWHDGNQRYGHSCCHAAGPRLTPHG
jgi:hypothetical protein